MTTGMINVIRTVAGYDPYHMFGGWNACDIEKMG